MKTLRKECTRFMLQLVKVSLQGTYMLSKSICSNAPGIVPFSMLLLKSLSEAGRIIIKAESKANHFGIQTISKNICFFYATTRIQWYLEEYPFI